MKRKGYATVLEVLNTENLAGVYISGDDRDLKSLALALEDILGDYEHYTLVKPRLLMFKEAISKAKIDHDLYYTFRYLYPDLIFVVLALGDFMNLSTKESSSLGNGLCEEVKLRLNKEILYLRYFSDLLLSEYSKFSSLESYKAFYRLVHSPKLIFEGYDASYITLLNEVFHDLPLDKRAGFIEGLPFMIVNRDANYQNYCEFKYTFLERNVSDIIW